MSRAGGEAARVGERFSLRVTLTEAEIVAFARSVHDHNPLHHDPAYARLKGYRGLIACGPHLSGIFMGMTATHFAQPAADGSARSPLGLGFELRFRAPVYPGEPIDLAWTVTGVEWKERLAGWLTRLEGDARARETILLSGSGTLLLRTEPRT